ncbi:MAG: sensor histidine kinase [Weeksellaceae bacterium]|nr:sensor histidine kinase [Weeksellaceae bacterium]
MKHFYVLVSLLFFCTIFSQNKKKIDSVNNIGFEIKQKNAYTLETVYMQNATAAKQLNYLSGEAKSLSNLSLVCYFLGKYEKDVLYSQKAIDIFQKIQDNENLSIELGELGYRMKNRNLKLALSYLQRAKYIAEKKRLQKPLLSLYNNYGVLKEMQKDYDSAYYFYKKGLDLKEAIHDELGIPYSLNNMAYIYFLKKDYHKAEKTLQESLELRKKIKDTFGISENYSFLGDVFFETKDYQKSIENYRKSLDITKRKHLLNLSQSSFLGLSKNYEALGNTEQAFANYKKYAVIKDSLSNINLMNKIAEMDTKYETEKKQNLIIQQQFEIKQKNNWLIFGGILSLILLVVLFFIYKNYQQKQEKKLQKEIFLQQELATKSLFEGEQNERIRIARDLHDSVGQMLSLVKMNLSSQEQNPETKNIQSLVDKTIAEVRTVSHNLIPEELNFGIFPALENLSDKINNSSTTKMELNIPMEIKEIKFQKQNELSIYRIVQEVVNNMIKHADASFIILSVRKLENSLIISIRDNGKGMNEDEISKSKGIGWKNINARVRMLDGKIKIESEKLAGTQIEITLPQNE